MRTPCIVSTLQTLNGKKLYFIQSETISFGLVLTSIALMGNPLSRKLYRPHIIPHSNCTVALQQNNNELQVNHELCYEFYNDRIYTLLK